MNPHAACARADSNSYISASHRDNGTFARGGYLSPNRYRPVDSPTFRDLSAQHLSDLSFERSSPIYWMTLRLTCSPSTSDPNASGSRGPHLSLNGFPESSTDLGRPIWFDRHRAIHPSGPRPLQRCHRSFQKEEGSLLRGRRVSRCMYARRLLRHLSRWRFQQQDR